MNAAPQRKNSRVSLSADGARSPRLIRSAVFGILFTAAIILTVLGTLHALSDDPARSAQAYPILLFNLALIVLLAVYLARRVWQVLFAEYSRRSAPQLHRRFVLFFSLAALLPAILVGGFSTSLISRNINTLYGDNVRGNLESAYGFLNQYLADELRGLSTQIDSAERFLEINRPAFDSRISYTAFLQRYARSLDVDSIYILNKEGVVYTRMNSAGSPDLELPLPSVFDYIEKQGSTGFQTRDDSDYLVGLTKLQGYDDAFLMVGKYLKSNVGVLSSLTDINTAKGTLVRYQEDQGRFRRTFFLTFLETAVLLLIAAVWLGIILANRVIEPLGRLVHAAERVRGGDLTARIDVKGDWAEMSDVGRAFNRMTRQLSTQREDLVREHDISEQRRQFSEAVLSGVTAGVIGLSQDGRITLMNASAERLTGLEGPAILDHPLARVLPEFGAAFRRARETMSAVSEHQIDYEIGGEIRNFDMRVSAYRGPRKDMGWVLTFDDMTRLVTAQRHSAWREVARRIAHEIKNPLTPIQLATERLKRKYAKDVASDPDVFDNCTDTILRQVGSLENMVDEFSSFARMPAPNVRENRLNLLLDKALFEQGVAYPDISFSLDIHNAERAVIACDERLIGQALSNLYKNAAIAVSARVDEAGLDEPDGEISTKAEIVGSAVVITISDNGPGWPFSDRERLLEPYVTTRESGTGLGLAIVERIIEDHKGRLMLSDRSDGRPGASVSVTLPIVVDGLQSPSDISENNVEPESKKVSL